MDVNNKDIIDDTSIGEVTLDLDYVVADYDDVEKQRFHESEEISNETDIDFEFNK